MKFVSFSTKDFVRAGVLLGDGAGGNDQVVDLAHPSMRAALRDTKPQMLALIDAGLAGAVVRIGAHGLAEDAKLPLNAVTLTAPLPKPRRIFGIAHNYRDALAERGMAPPDKPVLFMKAPRTITGTGQPVVLPPGIGGVTYEAELAAVIGTRAEKVSKDAGARSRRRLWLLQRHQRQRDHQGRRPFQPRQEFRDVRAVRAVSSPRATR